MTTRFTTRAFLLVILALIIGSPLQPAAAQQGNAGRFDHAAIGFPLSGGHANVDCASCHTAGRFLGTPRRCSACHNGSRAIGKPGEHVRSANACEGCHSISSWQTTRVDHTLLSGTCASCHNGTTARGKPQGHIVTTAPCETCHRSTVSFAGARMDHAGISGNCASCHNGTTAPGKPRDHPATSAPCENCHRSTSSWSR